MEEKLLKKLFRETREVKMTKDQKSSARDAVLQFMKNNPLPQKKTIKTWLPVFNFKYILVPATGLAAILLLGFIVSAKADSALPGDVLYPVKLGKEQVMQVLASTDQAKLDLSIQFAERRLQEAEKLTVSGKINNHTQTQLNNNFQAQTDSIQKDIQNLNNIKMYDEASKVASDFEATLKAHNKVLQILKKDNSENVLQPLINKVADKAQEISETRINSTNQIFSQKDSNEAATAAEAAQEKIGAAEQSVKDLKKTIEEQKNKIENSAKDKIQENLKQVEQKITESKDKINSETKDYKGSFSSSEDAIMSAKELDNLIRAKVNLKVNDILNSLDNQEK